MTIGLWTVVLGAAVFLFYFWLPEIFPKMYKNSSVWTFLLYTLVPVFWLFLITDLYVLKWIPDVLGQGTAFRLSDNVFWVWENLPVSQHHWLPFFNKNDLGTAYSSQGFFAYLFFYASAKVMAWVANTDLAKAQFMLVYLYALLQVWVVVFSLQKLTSSYALDRRQRFSFFYLVSFFVLLPGTWVTIFHLNQDNIMPLVGMYAFFWAVCLYKEAYLEKGWFAGLLLLGIVAPIPAMLFTIMTIGYIYFSDGIPGNTKKVIYVRAAIALIIPLVCLLTAKLVIKHYGINDTGSSFWFRSGLDGDTTYFRNLIDSVIYPIRGRFRIYSEFLPMIGFLFVAYIWGRKIQGEQWQRLFLIATSYYLLQLVLFPQAVKIHPYLYDASLTIPVLGISFYVFLRPAFVKALSASGFLYYNLLLLGLVLSNLIILARAARGPLF